MLVQLTKLKLAVGREDNDVLIFAAQVLRNLRAPGRVGVLLRCESIFQIFVFLLRKVTPQLRTTSIFYRENARKISDVAFGFALEFQIGFSIQRLLVLNTLNFYRIVLAGVQSELGGLSVR